MIKGIDYTGIAVVYYCHDGHGRFVMAKRSTNTRDEHGTWDPGGGALEFGDTLENTLSKEIKEEYGADVISYEFLGFRDVHRIHAGKPTHWIAFDYKVLVDPTQVKNCEPHKFEKVDWFTIDNLPNEIHSQLPDFIQRYHEKLI